MDLSIIIVSWNVKDKLRENLNSLFNSESDFNFEVFVVDNNSLDGSAEMVKNEFPQVKVIANQANLGFARANNQAIKYAQGRFILLLNPDMRVFPDTLNRMIGWLDNHQGAAIASCNLINEQGKQLNFIRRFPTVWNQLAIILKISHLFPGVLNKYLPKDFDYKKEATVDSIRGSFFMISRETINKIGRLDERYFIWFEEVDYCRQANKVGLKVIYTPVAQCVDYVGVSFSQVPLGKKQKYFRDSMLKYFKKWHSPWQSWLLKIVWPVGIFLAYLGQWLITTFFYIRRRIKQGGGRS
ncbi:hypothetical protein CO116_00395 [Candidatus Falkowbacteria bacterium CG_4_9_14_3_um_filter_38_19]|uniref:Glycosyltransferase 2-like domain-containing protein n=2 Tax=Candidatus Falkowiibacteriota TaxID=1752728 RepID=A0A2M8AKE8_9BACT